MMLKTEAEILAMPALDRLAAMHVGVALAAAMEAWLADVPMSWLIVVH